jgi:hypothetical protein
MAKKTTKKAKKTIFKSPAGAARYPHVREPHQYTPRNGPPVGAPKYSVELVVPAADMEAFRKEALAAAAQNVLDRGVGDGTEDVALRCFKPFKGGGDEIDPTKEIATFKQGVVRRRKDGSTWNAPPPPVYDSAGVPMPANVDLTPGSKIVVAWTPYVWEGENSETGKTFLGLSLNLEGIRVLELAAPGADRSASDLGFETDGPSIFGADVAAPAGDTDDDDDSEF